jgi:hypothetical protein
MATDVEKAKRLLQRKPLYRVNRGKYLILAVIVFFLESMHGKMQSKDTSIHDGTSVKETGNPVLVAAEPPAAPEVTYAELDGKVIFEWGSNLAAVNATEQRASQPGDYTFEGYNIYQLPNAGSSMTNATRIATYDLVTDPSIVIDWQYDPASGTIIEKPVQFGSNSGITRYFLFDRDYINNIPQLINGTEYYIAITAYSVSRMDFLPKTLETHPQVFRVTPQSPNPWSVDALSSHDFQHNGMGDADIDLRVINPAQLTGQSYTVGFSTQSYKIVSSYTNYGEDENENTWNRYILTGSLGINEADTSISYDIRLSDLDSLSGTPISVRLAFGPPTIVATYPSTPNDKNYIDVPTGAVVKDLTMIPTIISGINVGVASGIWTSTDTQQPLTGVVVDEILNNNLYVVVTTSVYSSGEASACFNDLSSYPWYIDRGYTRILSDQQNLNYDREAAVPDNTYPITDGFQFRIGDLTFKAPISFKSWAQTIKSNVATAPFTLAGDYTIFSGTVTAHAIDNGYGGDSVDVFDYQHDLEMRFTGVRAGNAEDTIITAGGSIATVYSSNFSGSARIRVPYELWEIETNGRTRQINVVVRDRNADGGSPWGSDGTPEYIRMSSHGRAYIVANSTPYDSSISQDVITRIDRFSPRNTWIFVPEYTGDNHWDAGDVLHINIKNPIQSGGDTYTFTMPQATTQGIGIAHLAPTDYSMSQNYPDPFNPTTKIEFTIMKTSDVNLRVFNLLGQTVSTLVDGRMNAGTHTVLFKANGLASGIYFYRIEAGKFVSIRKMVLMK